MSPRLLLHIGTEKTGTTAWQAWLAMFLLSIVGICRASSLGPTNHRKLPTSCFDLDRVDDFVIRSGLEFATPIGSPSFYGDWQQAFAAEVQQRQQHTWLVEFEATANGWTRPGAWIGCKHF